MVDVPEVVAVTPQSADVTVYCVVVASPLDAGAVQDAVASTSLADTPVGTPGTFASVTALDEFETSLVATQFVTS